MENWHTDIFAILSVIIWHCCAMMVTPRWLYIASDALDVARTSKVYFAASLNSCCFLLHPRSFSRYPESVPDSPYSVHERNGLNLVASPSIASQNQSFSLRRLVLGCKSGSDPTRPRGAHTWIFGRAVIIGAKSWILGRCNSVRQRPSNTCSLLTHALSCYPTGGSLELRMARESR